MTVVNATDARSKLYSLIDETTKTHVPIVMTGKRGNTVLLSEEGWNSIEEALYLLSIAGVKKSIKERLNEKVEDCANELDW